MKPVQPSEREKVMQAMMHYTNGKQHKQIASRAFLAGVRFQKTLTTQ